MPLDKMTVVVASAVLGLVGILATRWGVGRLAAGGRLPDAHTFWLLGLVALLPGWLVAFVALLGAMPGGRPPVTAAVPWILSTAAALVGAIASEARVRRAGEVDPVSCWWAGLAGFVPAWALAVAGHVLQALVG
jgi:hypothetical protein